MLPRGPQCVLLTHTLHFSLSPPRQGPDQTLSLLSLLHRHFPLLYWIIFIVHLSQCLPIMEKHSAHFSLATTLLASLYSKNSWKRWPVLTSPLSFFLTRHFLSSRSHWNPLISAVLVSWSVFFKVTHDLDFVKPSDQLLVLILPDLSEAFDSV